MLWSGLNRTAVIGQRWCGIPAKNLAKLINQWQECFKEMLDHVQFVEDIPKDVPRLFPTTCRRGVQLSGSNSC